MKNNLTLITLLSLIAFAPSLVQASGIFQQPQRQGDEVTYKERMIKYYKNRAVLLAESACLYACLAACCSQNKTCEYCCYCCCLTSTCFSILEYKTSLGAKEDLKELQDAITRHS